MLLLRMFFLSFIGSIFFDFVSVFLHSKNSAEKDDQKTMIINLMSLYDDKS